MDSTAQSADELQLLRALCAEPRASVERLELLRSLQDHVFLDPEHQVVFESIRFLLSRAPISAVRLAVHLNNRGFPDVDLEKYFPAAPANRAENDNAKSNKS